MVYHEMIAAVTDIGDFVAILQRCISKTETCQSRRRDIADQRCRRLASANVRKTGPRKPVGSSLGGMQ